MRKREPQVRVEETVETDARRMADDPFEHPIAEITTHQAVTVVEPNPMPLGLDGHSTWVRHEAQLLTQERAEPEVVVACQIVYGHAGAPQISQSGQSLEMPSRNCGLVFEPEVEEVANDVERRTVGGDVCQEAVQAGFTGSFPGPGLPSEMGVGEEVDGRPRGHARQSSHGVWRSQAMRPRSYSLRNWLEPPRYNPCDRNSPKEREAGI
jgi:hypothetical protein